MPLESDESVSIERHGVARKLPRKFEEFNEKMFYNSLLLSFVDGRESALVGNRSICGKSVRGRSAI